jgi:type I restriction enzyme, S subunit
MKPGYKQTDVGEIPEEWEVKCLGELGSVVRGGSPRPAGDSRYFNGNFIPWLTVASLTNISDEQLRVTETTGFLTEEGSKHSRTLVDETLIIANSGATLGVVKILGMTCCANDGIAAIINQRSGDKEFICHYINTRTKHLREVVATGNGQPNLNTALIREIPIPFPSLTEQRAIAAALSDMDALLASLDRLIAKQRDLKQAAMQQLLTGQTRLPGFQGEWQVKRLGDIGACLRGVSYRGDSDLSPHDTPETKRLLRSNNVQNAIIVTTDIQFVNSLRVSAHQMLRENDILICMANGSKALVGKAGLFRVYDGCDYTFGAFMGCFRTDYSKANPSFVFYLFQTGRYRDYINNLLAGSSINNLSSGSIQSLEFSTPPLPEQTAIATVLSDMDMELAALEQRRDKTRALKQGMMQELLTGRTRLV